MNEQKKYEQEISKFIPLGNRSIFFYWKGRVALYALLKAIGVNENDEVVLPGLTCVVVPNAIRYLNATPIYVDVSLQTCNTTFDAIVNAVSSKTKVIIVQNTFGLSSDIDRISSWAKNRGIITIEDCTHGFGGIYNGKPNGTYCDAAIYSTQWNKPFSSGIGGFSIVSNEDLVEKLVITNSELVQPTILESIELRLLQILNKYFLTDRSYWLLLNLYRWLSRIGIVIGSSSSQEIEGITIPKNYFKSSSYVQIKEGLNSIKRLKLNIEIRRNNALKYTELLSKHGKYHVDKSLHYNHSFLKYPILLKNRAEFIKKAEQSHIKLGDWFVSPLHPAVAPFDSWMLNENNIPNAVFLANHLLNLPTDLDNIEQVNVFIENNIDDFLDNEWNIS